MNDASLLHRLPPEPSHTESATSVITIHWYEQEIAARPGDTVASALLLAGVRATRHSAVSGAARLPFCMMGSCFECLLEVDGQIVQGCMTPVAAGMCVKMPDGAGMAVDSCPENATGPA